MNIKKLQLENFKCFERLEIDFEDIPGLYQIKGNIGSGKSSMAEGILYSIYGTINGKKNGDLIRWGTKHGKTHISLTSKGHEIVIDRELNSYGQSPMTVFIDGEPMACPDKRFMQNMLETEYLDVTRQVMELLCVISFNNFTSLSQMNTKTTRMFLDNVLGLDLVTTYQDNAKELAATHNLAASRDKIQIEALQNERRRGTMLPGSPAGDVNEVQNSITNLKKSIQNLKNEASEAEKKLKEQAVQFQDQRQMIVAKKAEITAIGKRLAGEIKFIERGKCPTCGADIDQSHLETKKKERDLLRESLKDQNTLEANCNAKLKTIEAEVNGIHVDLANKTKALEEDMKQQNNVLALLKASEEIKKFKEERLAALEEELSQLQKTYNENEMKSSKYSELSSIISTTIRSKIMEGIVPVINKYCKLLSESVGMDFYPAFDSEFDCSIHRGNTEVSRASLSTGQGKMVDTIIILAILVSIAKHVNCNIALLDELMSNLDNEARSQLLFVIRQYMKDKTILIVSHQELDRATLDGVIKVTRDANNSASLSIEKFTK